MSFVSFIANKVLRVEDVGINANGIDIQGIDEEALNSRGEKLPVILKERDIYSLEILPQTEIRDEDVGVVEISQDVLKKYRDYNFFITNSLDKDVRIGFRLDGFTTHVPLEDGSFLSYDVGSGHAHHLITKGARNVKLSDVGVRRTDGNEGVASGKSPFKGLYIRDSLEIVYRAVGTPSSGHLTIHFVGVPN